MSPDNSQPTRSTALDALAAIAGYYRIAADPSQLASTLGADAATADIGHLLEGSAQLGLRARHIRSIAAARLAQIPLPAIIETKDHSFCLLVAGSSNETLRLIKLIDRTSLDLTFDQILDLSTGTVILVTRKIGGAEVEPENFGFAWFLPSLKRYKNPLLHVLGASLALQILGLVTPLFFQLIVDKVLVHKTYSTLVVLIVGLAGVGLFEIALQYLRSYTLNHTTNRIDVELGRRLFHHLFRLPIGYFESRPAGQTVARMRELETIRAFLTGQGLSSVLDLAFTIVLIGVLFLYSAKLALIIIASIPIYVAIGFAFRPALKAQIDEKFNRGAQSQQFLVESILGAQTLKASGVEPAIQLQWEERLAAYVRTSFDALMLGSFAQSLIQYTSKAVTALTLFLGAQSVIASELTVGELIAFNMIGAQVIQPILRLSQLWQDFQQVQTSVRRLGDILNAAPEPSPSATPILAPLKGAIAIADLSFAYPTAQQPTLVIERLAIDAGEHIGIVGPSGSGKSTLTKLVQRLYAPQRGAILIDGYDIAQMDPQWLRRQIGVVLQENVLFNRSIHDNIALANPALERAHIVAVATLAGAHEFISKLPLGYDTILEERGANLSGGQRQRIAIARALVTNPRLLILDEATSALDYESERILQTNMRRIAAGRTVITIAHRLAAVRDCDRIIAIADGKIVEQGSHHDLVAKHNSLYGRLWRLQTAPAG